VAPPLPHFALDNWQQQFPRRKMCIVEEEDTCPRWWQPMCIVEYFAKRLLSSTGRKMLASPRGDLLVLVVAPGQQAAFNQLIERLLPPDSTLETAVAIPFGFRACMCVFVSQKSAP
jgi:hypothetical protein